MSSVRIDAEAHRWLNIETFRRLGSINRLAALVPGGYFARQSMMQPGA